jgi:hypothetical protein
VDVVIDFDAGTVEPALLATTEAGRPGMGSIRCRSGHSGSRTIPTAGRAGRQRATMTPSRARFEVLILPAAEAATGRGWRKRRILAEPSSRSTETS